MHILSTLVIAVVASSVTAAAYAQTPAEDSSRSRVVQQTGLPSAPASTSANDSVFRRAEQLVREGRGDAGRALVDTVLARIRPGSAAHAQALYWHASLAADAAEAERAYRRVIVEYPATHWAGDALLNLAQLELARGDEEQALVHLYRFEREYPSHGSRARAAFWLARLHFDKKNEPRGCAALATARVAASPEDVELRNQIDYHAQRCIGVDTTAVHPPRRAVVAAPSTTNRPSVDTPVPVPDAGGREIGRGGYTVQVAAFGTRAGAEALIERLRVRGYTARLASGTRPFRVRIGRYDTRADAIAAQGRLKAKGINGFVTEIEKP